MVVCFIGHRAIINFEQLRIRLTEVISHFISNGADTFLFGSRSRFNTLCLEIVTGLKKRYPNIKRVYIRAEYPIISKDYEDYLLESYEETFFPREIQNAGRCAYVERNKKMIDSSDVCIFYFNSDYKLSAIKQEIFLPLPNKERKSGTAVAFAYAKRKNKEIINLYER